MDYKRTEKSIVTEYAERKNHNILFNEIKILNKKQNYKKIIINEAIEINKYPSNFNREDGWKIVIHGSQ